MQMWNVECGTRWQFAGSNLLLYGAYQMAQGRRQLELNANANAVCARMWVNVWQESVPVCECGVCVWACCKMLLTAFNSRILLFVLPSSGGGGK